MRGRRSTTEPPFMEFVQEIVCDLGLLVTGMGGVMYQTVEEWPPSYQIWTKTIIWMGKYRLLGKFNEN